MQLVFVVLRWNRSMRGILGQAPTVPPPQKIFERVGGIWGFEEMMRVETKIAKKNLKKILLVNTHKLWTSSRVNFLTDFISPVTLRIISVYVTWIKKCANVSMEASLSKTNVSKTKCFVCVSKNDNINYRIKSSNRDSMVTLKKVQRKPNGCKKIGETATLVIAMVSWGKYRFGISFESAHILRLSSAKK